jgi:hypothetical protein
MEKRNEHTDEMVLLLESLGDEVRYPLFILHLINRITERLSLKAIWHHVFKSDGQTLEEKKKPRWTVMKQAVWLILGSI